MSEFNINVQGGSSVRLPTAGKYCEKDIIVTASGGGGTEEFVGIKYSNFDSYRGNPKVADARSLPVDISDAINGGYPYLFANNTKNSNGGWHAMVEDFYLPDGIQSLYSYMFYYCGALKNIYGDLTRVTIIYSSCFQYSYLEKFDYYCANLTTIQNNAFNSCSKLIAVTLRGSNLVSLSNQNAFTNTPIANGTGYIYVPRALVDTYKSATNWTAYANQFRALEDYTVDGTITGKLDESKI